MLNQGVTSYVEPMLHVGWQLGEWFLWLWHLHQRLGPFVSGSRFAREPPEIENVVENGDLGTHHMWGYVKLPCPPAMFTSK